MRKLILEFIAGIANGIYFGCRYEVKKVFNKPFIIKHCHEKGIASLIMYRVFWFFYIPFIEINDAFYTFEKDEQEFIIRHELGHYKYKHHKIHNIIQVLTSKESNELEKQADLYALLCTNKEVALRTLNKVEDYLILAEVEKEYIDLLRDRIVHIEKVKERAN